MKEIFEKHKDSLSSDERQVIWTALRKESSTSEHGLRSWSGRLLGRTRRRFFWTYPAFGVLATAVLVVVLLHHRGNPVPGLPLNPPAEMTGASVPSAVPTRTAEEKRAVSKAPEASPALAQQDLPPAASSTALPEHGATAPASARLLTVKEAVGKKASLPPSLTERRTLVEDLRANSPGSAAEPRVQSETEGSVPAPALEGKASEVTTRSPVSSPQSGEAGPLQGAKEVAVTARREVIQKQRSDHSVPLGDAKTWGGISQATRGEVGGAAGLEESEADLLPRHVPPPPRQPPVLPSTGGSTLPNDEVYDSMFFKHYGVNPFVATDEDPLSTFAVDVDAASYTVARKYLELGHLPPPEAVRLEEFVNFFPQDYPSFTRPDFRILVEGAPSPFGKGYFLLRVGLKGREIEEGERKPANLVFVIDVSGSMEREDRLELVKRALRILVDELTPSDRVGIVVYTTTARVLLDPVSLREREEILEAIERLHPEGSTNAEDGLRLGYEMARRIERSGAVNRIILCTDGVANEGVTSAESILEEVRRQADKGIQLTAIGFGMGNYNDVLLEKLADKGDGNYYYVDNLDEARRVLRENLAGTLETIANDAKVQVEFDPGRVLRYRLLGFENRDVADRDFRNDRIDAGEIGAGHAVTALYEIKLAPGVKHGSLMTVRLRYAQPGDRRHTVGKVVELEESFRAEDLHDRFRQASPSFRLDAAVAEFAEILRGSYWAKESRIEDVLPVARAAANDARPEERVEEFVRLVERAVGLKDKLSPEEKERDRTPYPDEGPDQRRYPDEERGR